MNNDDMPPAPEPEPEKKHEPESSKPEAPSGTIREQILALVPDPEKSQVASLLDSLVTHTPPPHAAKKEDESPVVKQKYSHLPFRPRITREETKREATAYGSLADE